MRKQVEAIKTALEDALAEEPAVHVKAAVCFVDAEWSLFAKPFELNDVWIGWATALGERLLRDGPISSHQLPRLAERVAARLPVA